MCLETTGLQRINCLFVRDDPAQCLDCKGVAAYFSSINECYQDGTVLVDILLGWQRVRQGCHNGVHYKNSINAHC